MPNYEVEHVCPLTQDQKDQLAEAITHIHCKQFSAPKLFVNVRITDVGEHDVYVAGKRRKTNRIFAYVRHGPSRTQEDYNAVSVALQTEWNKIVPGTELRLVMYYGAIIAGWEAGFSIPEAGGDAKWMEEHWDEFVKKADEGDQDFAQLVQEHKDKKA